MLAQEHMGFVDALRYGTARNNVTIAAALAAIGSSKAILVLTQDGDGVWTLASNVTIPINVTLWIPGGVTVSRNAGVTLTVTGNLCAFNHQWQQGAGTTVFNPDIFTLNEFGQVNALTLIITDPQATTPNRPSMVVGGATTSPSLQFYSTRGIHGPSIEWLQPAATTITTWQILGLSTGQLQFSRPNGNAMIMLNDVGMSLGNISVPAHVLHLGIDDAFKPGTNTWGVISDARTKTVVRPFTEGLATLNALPDPVVFTYNGQAQTPTDGKENVGYIAQDLLPVAPYLVVTSEQKLDPADEAPTTLYNTNLSPMFQMLVNAVKELDTRLLALETPALHGPPHVDAEAADATPHQRKRHS